MSSQHILILGLDGATWDLLQPWLNENKLPCLASLRKQGAWGNLRSTIPPITGPAWVSFATGKNPGKHGVFDFVLDLKNMQSSELVDSTKVNGPRFYEMLSNKGKRVALINLPVTYPPRPINGAMITSLLTPPGARNYYYPESLESLLKKAGYQIDLEVEKEGFVPDKPDSEEKLNELLELQKEVSANRTEVAQKLMEQEDWDMFFILYKGTDVMQHLLWNRPDKLFDYYLFIDEKIKTLCENWKQKHSNYTIFVISDHGFHAASQTNVSVTRLLEREGMIDNTAPSTANSSLTTFKRFNQWLKNHNIHLNKLTLLKKKYDQYVNDYWKNQPLIARGNGLFLNPAIFPAEKFGYYLDKIVALLKNLKSPDGETVFSEVYRQNEIFHGPFINRTYDVIYLTDPKFLVDENTMPQTIFSQRTDKYLPGEHRSSREGIFIASGTGIKETSEKQQANLWDIIPTALHRLGLPITNQMDGKVLNEILVDEEEARVVDESWYTKEKEENLLEGVNI